MKYPHENYLDRNRIKVSELPADIQEQISEFDQLFGELAPDNTSEEGKAVIRESKAIIADIKDHFSDDELDEPLKGDELNEWVLKQALGNASKKQVSFKSLASQGFNAPVGIKPKKIGTYTYRKASRMSSALLIEKS